VKYFQISQAEAKQMVDKISPEQIFFKIERLKKQESL